MKKLTYLILLFSLCNNAFSQRLLVTDTLRATNVVSDIIRPKVITKLGSGNFILPNITPGVNRYLPITINGKVAGADGNIVIIEGSTSGSETRATIIAKIGYVPADSSQLAATQAAVATKQPIGDYATNTRVNTVNSRIDSSHYTIRATTGGAIFVARNHEDTLLINLPKGVDTLMFASSTTADTLKYTKNNTTYIAGVIIKPNNITSASVTGTTTKTLTLNTSSGTPITTTFTDLQGSSGTGTDSLAFRTLTLVQINDSTKAQILSRANGTSDTTLFIIPTGSGITSASITWPGAIFNTPTSGVVSGSSLSFSPSLATQTVNKVFASPNGSSGTPTFRSLVAGDIPALPESQITNLTTDLAAKANNSNTVTINGSTQTLGSNPSFTVSVSGGGGAADSTYFWNRLGNVATYGNFAGTINNLSYRIRTNNVDRVVVDSLGPVSLYPSSTQLDYFRLYRGGDVTNKVLTISRDAGNDLFFNTGNADYVFQRTGTEKIRIASNETKIFNYLEPYVVIPTGTSITNGIRLFTTTGSERLQFGLDASQNAVMGIVNANFRLRETAFGFDYLNVFAQSGNVVIEKNASALTEIAHAKLALNGTGTGFLPNRMTTAQRTAIVLVAADDGLMVIDTDLHKLFVNENGTWVQK